MREVRRIISIHVFLICAITVSSKTALTELYNELNNQLSKREYYIDQKQKRIDEYKTELRNANTLKKQYELSRKITNEYASFNIDSVLFYSNKTIDIASELKDAYIYSESLIQQAYIISGQGYFHESIKILRSIQVETLSPKLLPSYYSTYLLTYHYRLRHVMSTQYKVLYRDEILKYCNLFLDIEPINAHKSFPYLMVLAYKDYQLKDYKAAVDLLVKALDKENITKAVNTNIVDREETLHKSNITNIQRVNALYFAYCVYNEMGKDFEEDAESYLLQSAILAIETAKVGDVSLINIALLQNEKGNYPLAIEYINVAIANMEFCKNTDFRTMAESIRLIIEKDYSKKTNKEQNVLYYSAILTLFLFALILGGLIYTLKKNKLLRATQQVFLNDSKKLILSNKKLSISNQLKNNHIIHWLNSSSYYINKLDETKKLTIKKINTKQSIDILKSEIETLIDVKEERLKLYSDFDKTFYKIHPDFISRINALLQENHHFFENDLDAENTKACTELRVLALIKLGVNDNKQIASFLQFTIQSVYNYRSSIKTRALSPDTFDDDFDKI